MSEINPGQTKTTPPGQGIIVKNNGSVPVTYDIRVVDASGGWSAVSAPGANDVNCYALSAIFTDTAAQSVDEAHFNEEPGAIEDAVSQDTNRLATDTTFACRHSAANGTGVLPGEERALWLKFIAPSIDTTQVKEHKLWLIIEAKQI